MVYNPLPPPPTLVLHTLDSSAGCNLIFFRELTYILTLNMGRLGTLYTVNRLKQLFTFYQKLSQKIINFDIYTIFRIR